MNRRPIQSDGIYEAHLRVADLDRAVAFYQSVLGLEVAYRDDDRRVAFMWAEAQRRSMLGLWADGDADRSIGHTAFRVSLDELLGASDRLRLLGAEPVGWDRRPTVEPWVFAWMPAAFVYFADPDGNNLELITLLDHEPMPNLGVVAWSVWQQETRYASRHAAP